MGVTTQSVRRYSNAGLLKHDTTPSGQRIYKQEYVNEFKGVEPESPTVKKIAYYARSSNGKTELIESQLEQLKESYGRPEKVYTDKSSGLNSKRKGLTRLLDDARDGTVTHVAVTQKDRLTRFGIEYLERLFNDYGITLLILHDKDDKSLQEELMQDFMSLIASFSGKFYRIRGYEQKEKLLQEARKRL